MSEEEKRPQTTEQPQAAEGAPQQQRLALDDTGVSTAYANFFLVTVGVEEAVLLFGIRSADGTRAKVEDRIVVSPTNAKRILLALSQALKRYEDTFGVIDLTPRTPAQTQTPQQPAPSGGGAR